MDYKIIRFLYIFSTFSKEGLIICRHPISSHINLTFTFWRFIKYLSVSLQLHCLFRSWECFHEIGCPCCLMVAIFRTSGSNRTDKYHQHWKRVWQRHPGLRAKLYSTLAIATDHKIGINDSYCTQNTENTCAHTQTSACTHAYIHTGIIQHKKTHTHTQRTKHLHPQYKLHTCSRISTNELKWYNL